jgi:hypothetical protein
MILNNIEGIGHYEHQAVKKYFSSHIKNERLNILWYPSAGNDYRDIIHVLHNSYIGKLPEQNIFIHTDYFPDWVDLKPGVKYDDTRTKIEISETFELTIKDFPGWVYHIDPSYVDFPEDANKTGKGHLVKLKIKMCDTELVVYFLYLFMENHNFLDMILRQIILQTANKISVNVVKVREGIAWGGVRNSRSITNSIVRYMSVLNPSFVIFDRSDCSKNTALLNCPPANNTGLKDYVLRQKYQISWNHSYTKFYDVIFNDNSLTPHREMEIIEQIKK